MQRILLIDDDPAIAAVIRRGLSYEGFRVEVASSGPQGLAMVRDNPPDLVVLDWMMPQMDGLEVLRRLRLADENLPVLFLTAKDTPQNQIEGLEHGADDYVVKPVQFEVLLARIKALLRRQQREQPVVLRYADLRLDPLAHTVFRDGREIELTGLEFRLLQTFMESPERVFSKPTLLDRVWGLDFTGDENVVEVYVKQLRQKLEAASETRLIQTLRGVGYVLRLRAEDN